jgi:hypothetical protein
LRWPADCHPVSVRFIEVPAEVHETFGNASAIPLQQMIAKNVGIRRARGQYIMATNLDIIFSSELMEFLAARTLEPGAMYRMDRHDIASGIPNYAPVDDLLGFSNANMLRVFTKQGAFDLTPDGRRKLEPNDVVPAETGIAFGPGWYPVDTTGREIYRWMEAEAALSISSCPEEGAALLFDLETGPSAGKEPLVLEFAGAGPEAVSATVSGRCTLELTVPPEAVPCKLSVHARGGMVPLTGDMRLLQMRLFGLRWQPGPSAAPPWNLKVTSSSPGDDWGQSYQSPSPAAHQMRRAAYLHTNACGDFTLLSRDDWFAMRAYAEFPIWPTHLDSLFCYAAYHAGIREVILNEPMRIFHIEHFAGAGWTPEGDDELNARIARKGVTLIPYNHFVEWVDRMRRLDAPMIFTKSDWGLEGAELPEYSR